MAFAFTNAPVLRAAVAMNPSNRGYAAWADESGRGLTALHDAGASFEGASYSRQVMECGQSSAAFSRVGSLTLGCYVRCTMVHLVLLTLTSFRALAHDPYEITSTLSLYSNHTEVRVEMEARTALLFVGQTATVSSDQIPALFTSLHDALTDTASRFFTLKAGDTELRPGKTSLLLGVEDHIQFNLQFPRVRGRSIHCEPRALQGFTNEGPYGISLTVLDMVNRKVLGQSVLFRDSPAADFLSTALLAAPKSDVGGSETFSNPSSPTESPSVVKIERSALEAPAQPSAFANPSAAPVQSPPAVRPLPLLCAVAFLFATTWSLLIFGRAKRNGRRL